MRNGPSSSSKVGGGVVEETKVSKGESGQMCFCRLFKRLGTETEVVRKM